MMLKANLAGVIALCMTSGLAAAPAAAQTDYEAENFAARSCENGQWQGRGYSSFDECFDAHVAYYNEQNSGGGGYYDNGGGGGNGGNPGGGGGTFNGEYPQEPNQTCPTVFRLCNPSSSSPG